ncbi:MAG: acyltransferase domain-containing protein [Candidatus Omnitrophica bacterium]|nr:acyltransferase domain-containing protein [Candidatus Omnitrophota bacterium]
MNAVLFPGQGAQYPGMGKSFYEQCEKSRRVFGEIDSILGFALTTSCFEGSADELKNTALQQLAIVSASIAAYEAWRTECSIDVGMAAGLSLGEYTGVYAAGVLELADVIRLVRERGDAMQEAAEKNPAVMYAVMGIEPSRIEELAGEDRFYPANYNSPQQTVVSLARAQRDPVRALLEKEGARVVELPVRGGFHSPLMKPAQLRLEKMISSLSFRDARFPLVSNVSAKPHTRAEEIRENLISQLVSPVRWRQSIECMHREGADAFYEVGPSKILRGLMRKIIPGVQVRNIENAADLPHKAA